MYWITFAKNIILIILFIYHMNKHDLDTINIVNFTIFFVLVVCFDYIWVYINYGLIHTKDNVIVFQQSYYTRHLIINILMILLALISHIYIGNVAQ